MGEIHKNVPRLSVCYIVENENNEFFKASLKSVKGIADEIIIIDGGSTDGTLDDLIPSMDKELLDKIKIKMVPYEHEYRGANGKQRNEYLKLATGDRILVLDADEILDDSSFILKEMKMDKDAYDVQMIHFIGNFRQIDATLPKHYCPRRFFKRKEGLSYPEVEHPVLQGIETLGKIDKPIIYHLGYLRGAENVLKKFHNHVAKSNIHSKQFLNQWKNSHILGTYPVKPFDLFDMRSEAIMEMIKDV